MQGEIETNIKTNSKMNGQEIGKQGGRMGWGQAMESRRPDLGAGGEWGGQIGSRGEQGPVWGKRAGGKIGGRGSRGQIVGERAWGPDGAGGGGQMGGMGARLGAGGALHETTLTSHQSGILHCLIFNSCC